jgi:hypothetical protein
MSKIEDPALSRGEEMLYIPMKDLPPLALEFARHLCKQYGMCIETMLTAYTVYAQCVEGLDCKDDLYKARDIDIEWFNQRKPT